jgi:hypothetical protein
MNMNFEDIYDILWDGTKAQINALSGKDIAFKYTPSCSTFTIRAGNEMSLECKVDILPNCVKILGNKHSFDGSENYVLR